MKYSVLVYWFPSLYVLSSGVCKKKELEPCQGSRHYSRGFVDFKYNVEINLIWKENLSRKRHLVMTIYGANESGNILVWWNAQLILADHHALLEPE